jgi:hypothetical protein
MNDQIWSRSVMIALCSAAPRCNVSVNRVPAGSDLGIVRVSDKSSASAGLPPIEVTKSPVATPPSAAGLPALHAKECCAR